MKLLQSSTILSVIILLTPSVILNIYYVNLNDYNKQVLNKIVTTMENVETQKALKIAKNINNSELIPNGFTATVNNNPLYWKYFKKIFIQGSDDNRQQFTIVIMTYQRPSLLRMLIPHYCNTGKYLNKFILIWNDVGGVIPKDILNHECAVPLIIKLPTKNKLTNRFFPFSDIETDAVFTIDDDRKVLHEDLVFAFKSWQQYRHKILGFEIRTHTILPNGSYYYGARTKHDSDLGYSLLISANFILHKAYLEMFQMDEFIDVSMIDYVNKNFNCEDLAMCTMVADFLAKVSYPQTSCVGMKAKHYPYNLEAENMICMFSYYIYKAYFYQCDAKVMANNDDGHHKGLSMRGTQHVNGRTKCLNEFKNYYNGALPIQHSNVLFMHEPESYYPKERNN